MTLRHFEHKARQSFWQVHIDAWQRSGLTRTEYCRQHRLTKSTLDRWLKHFAGKDAARKHAEYQAELRRHQRLEAREKLQKKRIRRRYAVSTDMRNRAVQAFWAMHVEAMTWSGMSVRDYAAALFLSPTSLRKWRDRLDDREVIIDWRAHLHPAARPVVGTSAGNPSRENGLTAAPDVDPRTHEPPARRYFRDTQKQAIAVETAQPEAIVMRHLRRLRQSLWDCIGVSRRRFNDASLTGQAANPVEIFVNSCNPKRIESVHTNVLDHQLQAIQVDRAHCNCNANPFARRWSRPVFFGDA